MSRLVPSWHAAGPCPEGKHPPALHGASDSPASSVQETLEEAKEQMGRLGLIDLVRSTQPRGLAGKQAGGRRGEPGVLWQQRPRRQRGGPVGLPGPGGNPRESSIMGGPARLPCRREWSAGRSLCSEEGRGLLTRSWDCERGMRVARKKRAAQTPSRMARRRPPGLWRALPLRLC